MRCPCGHPVSISLHSILFYPILFCFCFLSSILWKLYLHAELDCCDCRAHSTPCTRDPTLSILHPTPSEYSCAPSRPSHTLLLPPSLTPILPRPLPALLPSHRGLHSAIPFALPPSISFLRAPSTSPFGAPTSPSASTPWPPSSPLP